MQQPLAGERRPPWTQPPLPTPGRPAAPNSRAYAHAPRRRHRFFHQAFIAVFAPAFFPRRLLRGATFRTASSARPSGAPGFSAAY